MNLFNVHTIYYEKEAIETRRGMEVLDSFPDAKKVYIETQKSIPELYERQENIKDWNKIKSSTIVLARLKSVSARPNCRSTDFIAPSHTNGCSLSCAYCYIPRRKGHANPITIFTNIERICNYLRGHDKRNGPKVIDEENEQTDPVFRTYDIGENCDCSVDALLSDNVKDLVRLFRDEMKYGKASFATKYVNRGLLNYDPQRKTRIRFSLMPQKVSKVVDVRCSSIKKRIEAINDFHEAGYEVHLNFSPVIIYPGWQRDYIELFQQIDDEINDEVRSQLACEVIFLTHNERLHQTNMGWHPKAEKEYLWRYVEEDEIELDHKGKKKLPMLNKYGSQILQQRKLSQNGMVNLRYKNNHKSKAVSEFRDLIEEYLPYCRIRYIF